MIQIILYFYEFVREKFMYFFNSITKKFSNVAFRTIVGIMKDTTFAFVYLNFYDYF